MADSGILSQPHSLVKLPRSQLQPSSILKSDAFTLILVWALKSPVSSLTDSSKSLFQPQTSQNFMKLWVEEIQDQIQLLDYSDAVRPWTNFSVQFPTLETILDCINLGRLRVHWACPLASEGSRLLGAQYSGTRSRMGVLHLSQLLPV